VREARAVVKPPSPDEGKDPGGGPMSGGEDAESGGEDPMERGGSRRSGWTPDGKGRKPGPAGTELRQEGANTQQEGAKAGEEGMETGEAGMEAVPHVRKVIPRSRLAVPGPLAGPRADRGAASLRSEVAPGPVPQGTGPSLFAALLAPRIGLCYSLDTGDRAHSGRMLNPFCKKSLPRGAASPTARSVTWRELNYGVSS
jgi:hypothetical protein